MSAPLLALVVSLAAGNVAASELAAVVADVEAVVASELPLFEGELAGARDKTARLLLNISFHESAWRTASIGDCVDSNHRTIATCKSFGVMQVQQPEKWGFARGAIVKSRQTGFRAGLAVLRFAKATCGGSARHWLGLYASGVKCGWAQHAAKKRCEAAGVCEDL